MTAAQERIVEITDELDAMDEDGRFDKERDRYHALMVERSRLFPWDSSPSERD